MNASVSTVPFRQVVMVLAAGSVLMAMAAPAAGAELLLPEEDRRWLVGTEDGDGVSAVRLYDLLPPEDVLDAEDVLRAEDSVQPGEDSADEEDALLHEIAPGESLADIAAAYEIPGLDGWRRIYDANPDIDNPDLVEVGTLVRIPDADEELEPRELPVAPRPAPGVSRSGGGAAGAGGDVWDRLAACESGGNWAADTGNGYYGGLQFSVRSWQAVGGSGMPHHHDRGTQIAMGQRLQAAQGWGAWPSCARKLGLR